MFNFHSFPHSLRFIFPLVAPSWKMYKSKRNKKRVNKCLMDFLVFSFASGFILGPACVFGVACAVRARITFQRQRRWRRYLFRPQITKRDRITQNCLLHKYAKFCMRWLVKCSKRVRLAEIKCKFETILHTTHRISRGTIKMRIRLLFFCGPAYIAPAVPGIPEHCCCLV